MSRHQAVDGLIITMKEHCDIVCLFDYIYTHIERDPPWINKEIKKLMIEKKLAFKSYCSNRNMFLLEKFKALQYELRISIEESKEKYYTKLLSRLADPLTSPKTYWSILKTFLNKKNSLHTSSFS